MVEIAPRYDDRIYAAARALDDSFEPMAETVRRVGRFAAEVGLPKPSYSHLRRYIRAHRAEQEADRERAAAIRKIVSDTYVDALRGKVIDAYAIAERVRDARAS
jgi:hypothetical protein